MTEHPSQRYLPHFGARRGGLEFVVTQELPPRGGEDDGDESGGDGARDAEAQVPAEPEVRETGSIAPGESDGVATTGEESAT